jgi:hypothetical protein
VSGELRGGWLGKAVRSSGGSGVDERGRGEMGTGRRPAFVLKRISSVAWAEREKKGGGASAWRVRVEAGEGGKGGPSAAVDSAGRPAMAPKPAGVGGVVAARTEEGGGCGRRGRTRLTSGTGVRRGPVSANGVREREAGRRRGANRRARATKCRAAVQTVF